MGNNGDIEPFNTWILGEQNTARKHGIRSIRTKTTSKGLNQISITSYRLNGEIIERSSTSNNGKFFSQKNTSYQYNWSGQLVLLVDSSKGTGKPRRKNFEYNATTRFEYDSSGRLKKYFLHNYPPGAIEYTYFEGSRIKSVNYGRNRIHIHVYDSNNRLIHLLDRNKIVRRFEYDLSGNLILDSLEDHVFRFFYDQAGNRIKEESTMVEGVHGGRRNKLILRNVFTYDSFGNRIEEKCQIRTPGPKFWHYQTSFNSKNLPTKQYKLSRRGKILQTKEYKYEYY